MSVAASLPNDELARRCSEETEKFSRRQPSDPLFCFELLRRALAGGVAEAFTLVYQIYERQVTGWVLSHSRFAETGESAEFFARAALSKFYFALRGEKFARFPALPHVLAYLKSCVHTAIAQYLRDTRPEMQVALGRVDDIEETPDLNARAAAADLWAYICRLLPAEDDRALARYAFLQDLKPRQIVLLDPRRWGSEREVTVALYRIRRLLRADPELRRRCGLAGL